MKVRKATNLAIAMLALLLMILVAAAPGAGVAARGSQEPAPASPQASATPPQEYAGSDTCALCHEQARVAAMEYHKVLNGERYTRLGGGPNRICEACHGPGKAHADAGGDIKQIFSFKQASAAKVTQRCLKCHAQGLRTGGKPFDAHSRNSISCVNCHTVHASKVRPLLADKPENFCVTCHANVRAEFNRPYRHRLNEGVIGCLDCHNPHGSPQFSGVMKAQLRRTTGNEVACLKCHADLRGPFVFEHVPVRVNGCQSCHEAHGSVNPRMLIRAQVRFLCLECHTNSVTAMAGSPPAFHDLRTPRFQNCVVCHNKIHGSYVDQFFER